MACDPKHGEPLVADEPVPVDRLAAECPVHGTVPVHCPRCLGKRGGKRHKGTAWRRKKELDAIEKFSETTSRVLDLQPEAKMLMDMAEERKKLQNLAARMGWSKDEAELFFTQLRLDGGMTYLRHICDRMRMSPEERTELLSEVQKSLAVALGGE